MGHGHSENPQRQPGVRTIFDHCNARRLPSEQPIGLFGQGVPVTKRFRGYALIVTVEQNTHDRLHDLGESVSADGDLIERVLLDEEVCSYGSDRVVRLRGTSATAENIRAALDRLRRTVDPEDPVFFYFSGLRCLSPKPARLPVAWMQHVGRRVRRLQRCPPMATGCKQSVFCSLYPLGPTDQAIWERGGGDLSELKLCGQGTVAADRSRLKCFAERPVGHHGISPT